MVFVAIWLVEQKGKKTMWEIKDGTKLIARGGSIYDYESGAHFLSKPKEKLQFAVFNLPSGEILNRHIHKKRQRRGFYPTHEFFIVMNGKIEVMFYTEERVVLKRMALSQGDFYCHYSGGHGFKVILPNTVFIEVKHGPFSTVEADKIKF